MGFWSDERRRWYLLAVAWLVIMTLGFTGFLAQQPGVDRTLLDNLYLTLQLAVLSYGGSDGDLDWRLEVARFAAPLMAAGTLFQAASVVFRDQFERFRLKGFRGHTVVCGLGASGTRLALSLAGENRAVVGIDQDAHGPGHRRATSARHPGLCRRDPADPAVLRAVRLDRASSLVALCANDATNVAIAAAARQVPGQRRAVDLRCSVHVEDAELTQLLRRLLHDPTIPVVVRIRGESGLGASLALAEEADDPRFPGLRLFPLLDRTCSPALIDGGVREELARTLYEDHLARAAARGVVDPAWSALTDEEREAARRPPTA